MKTESTEKYHVLCPNCKSTFDVSEQMQLWKEELFREITKLIKKMGKLKLENKKKFKKVKKKYGRNY